MLVWKAEPGGFIDSWTPVLAISFQISARKGKAIDAARIFLFLPGNPAHPTKVIHLILFSF